MSAISGSVLGHPCQQYFGGTFVGCGECGSTGTCPDFSPSAFACWPLAAVVIASCSRQAASGWVTCCPPSPWCGSVAWGNGICSHRAVLVLSCQQMFCAGGHPSDFLCLITVSQSVAFKNFILHLLTGEAANSYLLSSSPLCSVTVLLLPTRFYMLRYSRKKLHW